MEAGAWRQAIECVVKCCGINTALEAHLEAAERAEEPEVFDILAAGFHGLGVAYNKGAEPATGKRERFVAAIRSDYLDGDFLTSLEVLSQYAYETGDRDAWLVLETVCTVIGWGEGNDAKGERRQGD